MVWGPDDWDAWTLSAPHEDVPPPVESALVHDLLKRIPGRRSGRSSTWRRSSGATGSPV